MLQDLLNDAKALVEKLEAAVAKETPVAEEVAEDVETDEPVEQPVAPTTEGVSPEVVVDPTTGVQSVVEPPQA